MTDQLGHRRPHDLPLKHISRWRTRYHPQRLGCEPSKTVSPGADNQVSCERHRLPSKKGARPAHITNSLVASAVLAAHHIFLSKAYMHVSFLGAHKPSAVCPTIPDEDYERLGYLCFLPANRQ